MSLFSTVGLTATPLNPRPDEPVTLTGDPATAQLTVTLRAGTHTIRARYNGNTDCPTATSDPVTVPVRPVLPVTGAGLFPMLAAGLLLVLICAGLLVTAGRRWMTHRT